ncbi:MAG: hypothetical protein J6C82_04410 [Clostridia bacterium]|nr:hypothetical protein [Clostridia bacterium]
MSKCSSCERREKGFWCNIKGTWIDEDMYKTYCVYGNDKECPIYQYYLQEYNKIVKKIREAKKLNKNMS